MNIDFVGRHLQVEEKTRILAAEKLERLKRFLPEPIDAHVVLEAGKFRHSAEIKVRCGTGEFLASEEAVDLHDALMLATEKVEEQAKRARKREVDHPRRRGESGDFLGRQGKGIGNRVGIDPAVGEIGFNRDRGKTEP